MVFRCHCLEVRVGRRRLLVILRSEAAKNLLRSNRADPDQGQILRGACPERQSAVERKRADPSLRSELALSRKKPLERREQIFHCAQDDSEGKRRDDNMGAKGSGGQGGSEGMTAGPPHTWKRPFWCKCISFSPAGR